MTINPIIPIPAMAIICVILLALKRKGVFPYIRQVITILLLFALNLRIMIPNDEQKVSVAELKANVILVVDDTISMLGVDCGDNVTRLDAVNKDCEFIIDKLVGAQFSIVNFHNQGQVLCPFSSDVRFIKGTVASIYPLAPTSATGSNLGVVEPALKQILQNGKDRGGYNIVFFFSDGEDNTEHDDYNFKECAELIDAGAVIGYGTEKGANMYIRDPYSDELLIVETYTYTDGYVPAVTKMDPKNLDVIASGLGLPHLEMGETDKMESIINKAKAEVEVGYSEKIEYGFDETYYYFAFALAIMMIVECVFTAKQIKSRKL